MIQLYDAKIKECILHFVGNKSLDESYKLSLKQVPLDENLNFVLTNYFFRSFVKNEVYSSFSHSTNLILNEVYTYVSNIFEEKSCFEEESKNIARYLYECSSHPKIKSGELYVVYFSDCLIEGKYVDAVGLFKSENKDIFLRICSKGDGFEIESESGININRLDKGCLIFNMDKEKGYVVAVVDNTNRGADAKYWTEDFLNLKSRNGSYNQTQNIINVCKSFVAQMPDVESKSEKAMIFNRGLEALSFETVSMDEYAAKVFQSPEKVEKFNEFMNHYQKDHGVEFESSFTPSSLAVNQKKRGMGRMTTIYLDKNFDINIHGGENNLEHGYDSDRKQHFYKLFFDEEK